MQLSLNIHNQLIDLSSPVVMAIVNITPDSFYTSWGNKDEDNLLNQIQEFVDQGADIIDIGACSTRPNSTPVDPTEEWNRLAPALKSIRRHFPKVIISVDTFRAEIAEKAIQSMTAIPEVKGTRRKAHLEMLFAVKKHPSTLPRVEKGARSV